MATVPSTNCSRSSLAYRQYATMPLSASSMTHLKTSTGRRRPAAIKLILRAQFAAAGRLATSKLVVPLGGSGHTTCPPLALPASIYKLQRMHPFRSAPVPVPHQKTFSPPSLAELSVPRLRLEAERRPSSTQRSGHSPWSARRHAVSKRALTVRRPYYGRQTTKATCEHEIMR